MDLSPAIQKFNEADQLYQAFQAQVQLMGGPALRELTASTLSGLAIARCSLVRDIAASIAQRELEVESLKWLQGPNEDPVQASYLRQLTKRVVKAIHDASVEEDLNKILKAL